MFQLLPSQSSLYSFLLASVILAVSPGPGVLYIVARTVVQGRRYGLISVAGMVLGNACNVVAACVGLAAVFAMSSMAFVLVKYAGAGYLVYLGIKLLRVQSDAGHGNTNTAAYTGFPNRAFREGFLVALLNPKTTLFFAAFLPQFLDVSLSVQSRAYQGVALGLMFVAVAAITDSIYALIAATVAPRLRGHASVGRKVGALVFIGLGIFAALGSMSFTQ